MKKTITTTVLILGLSAGLAAPQLMAANQPDPETSQRSAEQSWQDALKAQVALAKAKVLLLQARSELWVMQNREAALKSLDEARDSLVEGWDSADQVTRVRITELKLQIDQAKKLLQEKRQGAEAELQTIANQTESALNVALLQAQTKSTALKDAAATRYALAQAKAATLKARIALEIEESPEKAQEALKMAENALQHAKETASKAKVAQIAELQKQSHAVQQLIRENSEEAKLRISILVTATEERIGAYEKSFQESDETKLLKKRYTQLEAQAALLKAHLAMKTDATGEQAAAYLDESKASYESLKLEASNRSEKELAKMSADIEEVKQAVQRKDKQARAKLAELLEQAAEMVKDE